VIAFASAACGGGTAGPEFPPVAKRWYDRGAASFKSGDIEDAELAVENALRAAPNRPESRLLAGRVALARLDYDRALQVLKGQTSTEARSVRGRAYWYKGDVQKAAEELEALVHDPEVHDNWAVEIVKLARRGVGRRPFEMSGGLLAVMEMPRTGTASMIVPLEIDGNPALGMIATGTAEAVIDAAAGTEPSWASLRFGERIEVRDVPVLAKDLSGLSKQMNAPIKILIGVNLLRHLRPTIDFAGGQFVVRSFDPPPPPAATTLRINYARGGGMLLRGALGAGDAAPACSLLVDTTLAYPIALKGSAWAKGGVPSSGLRALPNGGNLRHGVLPLLRLGAFDVPHVPGLEGDGAVKEREQGLGVDIDGLLGSGLLATFRVTLFDGGRSLWLEDMPPEALQPPPPIDMPPDFDIPLEEYEEEEEAPKAAPGKAAPKAKPPVSPNAAPKKP
jgi:tetratricopeptide (TPR) repeat protein